MEDQNQPPELLLICFVVAYTAVSLFCICCRLATIAGQDTEGGQPGNNAQQDVEQPPLPPQKVLGTIIITYKNRETGETSDDCAICLEKFEDGVQCRVLHGCKHMYHEFCIDEWLSRDRRCPLCRGSLRGSGSSHQPHEAS
ncbi:hypothetical protein PTKIN_Ptkin11bG0027700 [Pterospermum kingtungense]